MARAHFVKSARKDNPKAGIKKGDSYWWWAFMVSGRGGRKHYSKTQPRPSQLTQSEFAQTVLSLQENADSVPDFDDIESQRDEIVEQLEQLKDSTQEKFDNMPESLQQGETGQLLEQRVESLDSAINDLESVDVSYDREDTVKEDSDEDKEAKEGRAEEIWSEVTDALSSIEL